MLVELVPRLEYFEMADSENNNEAPGQSATMAELRQGQQEAADGQGQHLAAAAEGGQGVGAPPRYGMDWFWVTFNEDGVGANAARTFQVNEDINNNIPDNNWN